jgi:Ca2+-dependent lipid-binding protein
MPSTQANRHTEEGVPRQRAAVPIPNRPRAPNDTATVSNNGSAPHKGRLNPKIELNGAYSPAKMQTGAPTTTNNRKINGNETKIPIPPVGGAATTNDDEKLELKRTSSVSSTTSTYSHTGEFVTPKNYTMVFPWKRIGSFIDDEDTEVSQETIKELSFDDNVEKLTTYIYEKYYNDIYWNCSLVIGCCFAAWAVTYIGLGFFSCFFVLICTFAVYRSEFRRFNTNLRDDMQRSQSTELLEKKLESMDWLNSFLAKFWVIYMPALSELVIANTNQVLEDVSPPPPILKLVLDEFTLGTKAPKIDSIQSFTQLGKDVYQMDWKFNFTPNDTSDMTQNELKHKVDPKIALGIKIGKGIVSASLPVLVEDMSFVGNIRIKLKLGDLFPHIDIVSICFMEPPKIDYALKPVGGNTLGIDVMSVIPGLSSFVKMLINSNLAPIMYYPNTIDIKPTELLQPPSAVGCLYMKIRGAEYISKKPINPYIKYGPEGDLTKTYQTDIKANTVTPVFNESKYILINDVSAKMKFEVFNLTNTGDSECIGESYFEMQDLIQDAFLEMNDSKITKNNRNVGRVVYDLKWYPVLKPETSPDGSKSNPPDSEIGIISLNILSASDLDNSKSLIGKLSTFIEVYIDNELAHKSRVVKGTNDPQFNFFFENLTFNKSTSIIRILIKDISSFKETVVAEYQSRILDFTLLNTNTETDSDPASKQHSLKFTSGTGSLKVSAVWKPLGPVPSDDDDNITFVPPKGVFRVHIDKCSNLPNLETLGTIDPYIQITSGGNVKGITEVVDNSLNPTFNEDIIVPILSENQKIRFDCLDSESEGKKDRLIGDLIIGISDFFKSDKYHEKAISFEKKLTRNGKDSGSIKYSLTYYPLMPVYSRQEIEQLEAKSREAKEGADDLDELEEQAKYLEDYKKNPDDYEWVDIDEDVQEMIAVNKNKVVASLDDLIQVNSGVLGINLLSATLTEKTAFIQIFIDDHSYPEFVSRKSKRGKIGSSCGDAFVRDLRHSILNVRISKHANPKFKSDILFETTDSFKVFELLTQGHDKPVELDLDGNKLSLIFEYVPIMDKHTDLFETFNDTGILELDILSASQLMSADRNGKSDPFVVGYLNNTKIFKTKTIKKTLDPEWNEHFITPVKSRRRQKLILQFFDWDISSDNDPLGNVVIDLSNAFTNGQMYTFNLDTQGSVNVKFNFKPGYIKPNSSVLLSNEVSDFDVSKTVGNAAGMVGSATGVATGVATGAVGMVGGVASGTLGGLKHGISDHSPHMSGMKLKPPFMGHRSKHSDGTAEMASVKTRNSVTLNRPSDVSAAGMGSPIAAPPVGTGIVAGSTIQSSPVSARVPPSLGMSHVDGVSQGRRSMDVQSVNTNAFNGGNAITGRVTILEVEGLSKEKESFHVKTYLKSANGSEKSIFKTRNYKIDDKLGGIKWNENNIFKCDGSSSMVFVLSSHHVFGKDEDYAHGEIVMGEVAGVRDNILVNMTGKASCSLVVNFNYA